MAKMKSIPKGTSVNAADAQFSLSQALLAPLDSIFKAQLHAARSFLNLLLQLGYNNHAVDENGNPKANGETTPYNLDFDYQSDDVKHRISIPALALVPIAPLGVESAEFNFSMAIESIARHQQMQPTSGNDDGDFDEYNRPWYLVKEPISMQGTIAPKNSQSKTSISITVKIARTPTPSGLEKLLTSLTQSTTFTPSIEDKKSV